MHLIQLQKEHPGYDKDKEQSVSNVASTPIDTTLKDEQVAGWPSFGQLVWDLAKLAPEALGGIFAQFVPLNLKSKITKTGLTPLKDSLVMPEDEAQPSSSALKQRTPTPLSSDRFSEVKPPKIRSTVLKDGTVSSSKHRSSRRQEYAEFYGSGEVPPQYGQVRSKTQKERSKHRQREKSGDAAFGTSSVLEPKPSEIKATSSYENTKYDPYSFRTKYGDTYRYD